MGMMRVHEYQVDPRTQTARVTSVNPIRRFVSANHVPINYQNGEYFYDEGQPCPESEVPECVKQAIAKNPVRVGAPDAEVPYIRVCPICEEGIPSNEYENHLVEHARNPETAPGADVAAPATKRK